jgi:hypothetical protein
MKLTTGILVGLMLCVSAGAQQQQQSSKSGPVGRYQIIMHQGEMPRINTFLLDTMTGKVWVMAGAPDGNTFWEPMDKVDNREEEAAYLRKHQKKNDQEEPK